MAEVELIGGGEEQAAHVDGDRQEIGAMPTSHRHSLEQARARHVHLFFSIIKIRSESIQRLRMVGGRVMIRLPRGRCHSRCSGRSIAARRRRGSGAPVRKWRKRTLFSFLIFFFF